MGGAYSSPPGLRIGTLGGLSLTLDGRPVNDLVSRRTEALLVYLACARRPQSREALAGLLWDEHSQAQAAGNFRVVVNSLRRSLGPFIAVDRHAIAFNFAGAFTFDAADFEAAARAARRDPRNPDRELLFRAAGLYRGDFLAGFSLPDGRRFEEWLLLERERLQRLMVETLDALAGAAERDGHYRAGIDLATRLLKIDSLRETTHRRLMRLHALAGERPAALAQYAACRDVLWAELGVEPDPETRALAARIRGHGGETARPARAKEAPVDIILAPSAYFC
jgi:DNA-binding SARP family transcriptional activator